MKFFNKYLSYILLLFFCGGTHGKKTGAADRIYHLNTVPQGIQYYASGSPGLIYPNVPASLYIPGQVGVLNLPPGVTAQTLPPNGPPTEATPTYHTPYPSRPALPSYYHQQQGASSFSIEQSVDLTDTSKGRGSVSTYGPPKSLDVSYRRPQGPPPHHRTYNRYKNYPPLPPRGSSSRPGGRPLMYTHYHKGHLHTHYIPSSVPSYKPPKQGPAYLPLPSTTPLPAFTPSTEDPQKVYNHHAFPSPAAAPQGQNLVRFPSSHEDLTQAVIGQTGVINNYDASLPVKIPNKKPNQLEVNDILKHADLHFVDVLENKPKTPSPHFEKFHPTPQPEVTNHQLPSFRPSAQSPSSAYQQPQNQFPGFPQHEERYPQVYEQQAQQEPTGFPFSVQGFHQQPLRNYAELYDQRFQVPQAFHNNHLEQDSGPSETYKVPVAIFKGVLPGMIPSQPIERSDEDIKPSPSLPADFTPSKTTSDWIPVTGGGKSSFHPKPETVRNLNQFGDDYFADLSKQASMESKNTYNSKPDSFMIDTDATNGHQQFPTAEKLTRNPEETIYGSGSGNFESVRVKNEKVGDIISGKIPGSHNPFREMGDRTPNNLNSGGVTTSSGNIRDGSNLVVSSVIKFSR